MRLSPSPKPPLIDEHLDGLALLAEPIEQHAENAEYDPGRRRQNVGDHWVPEPRIDGRLDPRFGVAGATRG